MKSGLLYCFLLLGSLGACRSKTSDEIKEAREQQPRITVDTPTAFTSYVSGDTVAIKGSFSDPVEIHSYSIQIWDQEGANLLDEIIAGHEHNDKVAFDSFWRVRKTGFDTVMVVFKVDNHNRIHAESKIPIQVID